MNSLVFTTEAQNGFYPTPKSDFFIKQRKVYRNVNKELER